MLFLWGSTYRGAVVAADTVPWLYEVAIAVETQSQQERQDASSEGLLTVLTRLTGLAHVPRTAEVTAALAAAESYYNEFRFVRGPLDDALALVIQFDRVPVLELIKQADLPIWRSSRAQVVAWVVVSDGTTRSLLGAADQSAVVEAIKRRAKARGIPLSLPLLDLEDQLLVTPAVVWGRLSQVLEPASRRYGARVILLGRAEILATGQWRSDWQFWIDNQVVPWRSEEGELFEQALAAVDGLADELAARSTVMGRETRDLTVSISGVRTAEDYGNLLHYLESLEFVDAVGVSGLLDSRLSLLVSTRATAAQLLYLLESDQLLFDDQLAIAGTAELRLVWRRQ